MIGDPSQLFLGSVPAQERSFLGKLFKGANQDYQRLVVPCAGQFATITEAVRAGFSGERIEASDVSLFTTTLAAALRFVELPGVSLRDPMMEGLDPSDPIDVLYALKLGVMAEHANNYYKRQYVTDLLRRRDAHREKLRSQIGQLAERLGKGIVYTPMDMLLHLEVCEDDPRTLVQLNPPSYKRGYERMFDYGERIGWTQPLYREFDPKVGYEELALRAEEARALVVWIQYLRPVPKRRWQVVASTEHKGGASTWLMANRPEEAVRLAGGVRGYGLGKTKCRGLKLRILPTDHRVTKESTVGFVEVPREVASYYRDLLVHRVATTTTAWRVCAG